MTSCIRPILSLLLCLAIFAVVKGCGTVERRSPNDPNPDGDACVVGTTTIGNCTLE